MNSGNLVFTAIFAVASIWGMNLTDNHVDSRADFDVVRA